MPICRDTRIHITEVTKELGEVESLADAQKEDIWGLGLVLYEAIFGHYPFNVKNLTQEQLLEGLKNLTQTDLDRAININTKYPRSEPGIIEGKDIIELLTHMLKVDPKERWTAKELLDFYNSKLKVAPSVMSVPASTSWLGSLLSPRPSQRINGQQQTVRSSDILKEFENTAEALLEGNQREVDSHVENAQKIIDSGPYDASYLKKMETVYQNDLRSLQFGSERSKLSELAERKIQFDTAVLDLLRQLLTNTKRDGFSSNSG